MKRRWLSWIAAACLATLAVVAVAVAAGRGTGTPSASGDQRTTESTTASDELHAAIAPERLGPWIRLDTSLGWQGGVEPDLRGKVVLYEFWTFGCFNCRNTLPYLIDLYAAYRPHGLEIVGIHYPEFDHERDRAAIAEASDDLGVTWPVLFDDDGVNWRAAENRWWPRIFVVDQTGEIRFDHIGEGAYTEYESAIRALLDVPPSVPRVIGG